MPGSDIRLLVSVLRECILLTSPIFLCFNFYITKSFLAVPSDVLYVTCAILVI
jgi:hypothetical protein